MPENAMPLQGVDTAIGKDQGNWRARLELYKMAASVKFGGERESPSSTQRGYRLVYTQGHK